MTWARIDDGIFFNPKVFVLSPETKLLYIGGIVYASKFMTDGIIRQGDLTKMARMTGINVVTEMVSELVSSGLWHETGDGWEIHDYLQYNPSREHVEAVRQKRVEAGRMGGRPSQKQNGKQNVNQRGSSSSIESTHFEDETTTTTNPFANQNAFNHFANQNAFEVDEDFAAAVAAWEDAGQMVTPFMGQQIQTTVDDWRERGYPHYVAMAVIQAAKANKLSWGYVEGILRRCASTGTSPDADNRPSRKNGRASNAPEKMPQTYDEIKAKYVPASWEQIIEH